MLSRVLQSLSLSESNHPSTSPQHKEKYKKHRVSEEQRQTGDGDGERVDDRDVGGWMDGWMSG